MMRMDNYLSPAAAMLAAVQDDTRRRRREACRQMAESFAETLASHSEDDSLSWRGSLKDLMEWTYVAYAEGIVRDEEGVPLTMRLLTSRICRLMHTTPPANPSKVALLARRRKGIRQPTLTDRFMWLRDVKGLERPMDSMIAENE